ncbi:class IV lanthionine synthetase LanL [Kitasatospora sp. NPDC058406]|uniref:class IV lanthionine synthetase LanL n=1 Tax=Kitasatospora sp. NPDC058406 TaxID=3346483 RepID=UPI00365314C5
MEAGTSLRTAGGTDSADHGPDAVGPWPEMTRAVLAGAGGRGGGDWRIAAEGPWCTARPPAGELADEGWKLHVSAASAVGGVVLAAVTEILAEDPCTFRFATGSAQLHEINSRHRERGSAGKFITVYPDGEPQFRRLAAALHRATEGLPGPVVLSDRPYRPGSLVHYRYGAIAARAELGNDGGYRSMLRGPGGERVEDVSEAAYRCPPWARDPLVRDPAGDGPGAGRPPARRRGSGGVLLAGRYVITGTLRKGAEGGVFLGRDTDGGTEVVVKQARAHIEVDRAGTDARTALRHEAALLARLDGRGLAPRPVELVEQDDSLFLVQERIAGQPLGSWVAARLRRDGSPDVDWAEAGPVAHALLDLVERVHEQGLVLRDLSPGNVLVLPDGSLRLVGLELAAEAGSRAGSAGAPGYRAPEQGPGRLTLVTGGASTADPETDLYALGGLFFLLATGHDPLLPEDLPCARPVADRLGRWLALAARSGATARRLAPAVLGLRAQEPRRRWSVARVREVLAGTAAGAEAAGRGSGAAAESGGGDGGARAPGGRPVPDDGTPRFASVYGGDTGIGTGTGTGTGTALPAARPHVPGPGGDEADPDGGAAVDRVLHDGLRHLAATATPLRRDRLWPVVPAGERSDPCNVQHGAAGVLAVLARAAATHGLPAEVRTVARTTARTAAEWVERRCAAEPVVLPGLHFGRSGAAWALLDAADALDDRALAGRAAELAARIPVTWPNPDVCHGAAGAGYLQLRFATGVPLHPTVGGPPVGGPRDGLAPDTAAFLDRAARCGHGLLATARQAPYGTVWPVPEDFDSVLAGVTHLGFAHGVAGVGAFLLAAAEATGDGALLDGATAAGRTIAATARLDRAGSGETAWWPQSADDPEHVRLAHWCSGSSGAGTFLLRLWRATGDPDAHRLALAAGRAAAAARWHGGITACHGLAGDGEYLLDLAEATGDPEFLSSAHEVGALLAARPALRDGLLVLPDETGTGCAAAYGTGTAGALAFLLRLRYGGPRLWTDPAPLPSATTTATSGRTADGPANRPADGPADRPADGHTVEPAEARTT